MYFLMIGVALLAMKYLEIGPVAAFPWWVVLSPFAMAVAWWSWADSSGYTKKKAVERENAKKQARIDRNRENLGMGTAPPKKKR
ncbi:MAG: TIGR04438 family Trp-rich protein [Ramlibacter sp.]